MPQTVYFLAGAGGVNIALPRRPHVRMCAIRAATERRRVSAGLLLRHLFPVDVVNCLVGYGSDLLDLSPI